MIGYVFPGQGAQFEGMGKDLYESGDKGRAFFEHANDVLGYRLSDVMLHGTAEELKETKITQPALFVHSLASIALSDDEFKPDVVAGHSLGEFSALVAAQALSFDDGLRLVKARALAMQKACEMEPSTMAAIVGLDDQKVAEICESIEGVVPANYNSPGQLVIS
ncbi:MAG TPA: ACP S-malonyltransferase, partial [Saprospiraceae bacterium]|nr:ACP S-malonyltransferase [Saprospiraceae bacterium]